MHIHKWVLKENNALSELHCLHIQMYMYKTFTFNTHNVVDMHVCIHVYMYMYITSTKAASSGDSASYVMVGIYSSSLS